MRQSENIERKREEKMVVCHGLDDRVRVGYATHESRLEQTHLATGDGDWLGRSALLPRWAQRPGG